MKNVNWVNEILDMQEAIDSTIHHMIAYRTKMGPWDESDVQDGWRVIRGIVDRYEKKLAEIDKE